ncbi:rhamnogalacturonan endolyase family protein [Streptomyces sp. NPDC001858]
MIATRRRRTVAVSAVSAALLAGLCSAPAGHAAADAPRRIVENLDRGLVAVPSGQGTFLSWRLLGTEHARHGDAIAFDLQALRSCTITHPEGADRRDDHA